MSESEQQNPVGAQASQRLRPADRAFLERLAAWAGPQARVALVGGTVRDALLGRTPLDLDVVVEGRDVQALAQAAGVPYVYHPAFDNATLSLEKGSEQIDGQAVDLVRARREHYPEAGQNPLPLPGTLEEDLMRRDFSVNALALLLPHWELLDPAGGQADLAAGLLRPLHARSFHEDASRLVRGARLAARLNLRAAPELLSQVPDALAVADQTPRLWAELKLLLSEPRPALAAQLLREWGAGRLLPPADLLAEVDALQDALPLPVQLRAAALLALAPDPAAYAQRLGLGEKPLGLLARARSDTFYPAQSPEMWLRQRLQPSAYVPLTGKDVLALGLPAGKEVGRALAYLAELRRTGRVRSAEEEEQALKFWVAQARD